MSDTQTYVVPDNSNDDFTKYALMNNGNMNAWGNNPFFLFNLDVDDAIYEW